MLDIAGVLLDLGPTLATGDSLLGLVVELHEGLHHVFCLPKWAELVVVAVSILLKEVILEHGSDIESDLVRVTQCRLTHQLHDLVQILRVRQHLPDLVAELGELRMVFLVESVESGCVFAVRLRSVDAREMLALSELLVQAPENLHDTRVAEVTGSEKSPPGGETAPTIEMLPSRSGEPRAVHAPARS